MERREPVPVIESTSTIEETPWSNAVTVPETSVRLLTLPPPFDLARTAAPAWWARGRWPNVDWRSGAFIWVGWEAGRVAWRRVRQVDDGTLEISGSGTGDFDAPWAAAVLGANQTMPAFEDPSLVLLAREHAGLRPWAAGSLFEGVVSSIVGQSISVAAAATAERRLCERYSDGIVVEDRQFWPPPLPEQLASSSVAFVRQSGVTTKRAEALIAVGALFATEPSTIKLEATRVEAMELLASISGIGPWTIQSALLWGLGAPDAHPTRDVALLRAARAHYPEISDLRDLDRVADRWRPYRAWAARLLWLDLLGYDRDGAAIDLKAPHSSERHIPGVQTGSESP